MERTMLKLSAQLDGIRADVPVGVVICVENGNLSFHVPTGKPRSQSVDFQMSRSEFDTALAQLDAATALTAKPAEPDLEAR